MNVVDVSVCLFKRAIILMVVLTWEQVGKVTCYDDDKNGVRE